VETPKQKKERDQKGITTNGFHENQTGWIIGAPWGGGLGKREPEHRKGVPDPNDLGSTVYGNVEGIKEKRRWKNRTDSKPKHDKK